MVLYCRLYNLMSRGLIMIPGGGSPLHALSQVIWLLHPNEGNYNQGFSQKRMGQGFHNQRMEQGFHHRRMEHCSTIGGWNSVLPSEDGTVFYHRRMEQCSTIGGWNSVLPPEDGTVFYHWRMEQCSTIGGWNSVLPSKDETLFYHRRIEQCSTIGGWNSVSTSTIGAQNNVTPTVYNGNVFFCYWGMEHGFLSTIREWNMVLFLFHVGGWNRVSTPP